MKSVEEKLFSKDGKASEKPSVEEIDPREVPKNQRVAITVLTLVLGFGLIAIAAFMIPKQHQLLRMPFLLAGMLMPSFGMRWITGALTRRRANSMPAQIEDPIAAKAFEIARQLKVKLTIVTIVEGDPDNQLLDLFYNDGKLTIPRRAMNELTDDELAFAMAFSLSQGVGKMMLKILSLIVPFALASTFLLLWLPRWMPSGSFMEGPQYRLLSMMLVPLLMAPFLLRLIRNEQCSTYVSALRICKSAQAARSYEPRRLRGFLTRNEMLPMSRHSQKLYDRSLLMLEKAIKDEGLG